MSGLPGIVTEELSLPGISANISGAVGKEIYDNYSVKYAKIDLDNLEDIATLQDIETRGLRGNEIVILSKDKFTFMQSYYIIISYLEKN